jgi:hypothetical protein
MSAAVSGLAAPVHAGWVMKRAVRTATKDDWKRRYLRLFPKEVSYYETDVAKKPKNSLPLSGKCRIRSCEYHFKNEIELYNPETGVAFYATLENEAAVQEWIVR